MDCSLQNSTCSVVCHLVSGNNNKLMEICCFIPKINILLTMLHHDATWTPRYFFHFFILWKGAAPQPIFSWEPLPRYFLKQVHSYQYVCLPFWKASVMVWDLPMLHWTPRIKSVTFQGVWARMLVKLKCMCKHKIKTPNNYIWMLHVL